MLEAVDVGLIPSTWEEAFGFVGLEFLAKGVPIIGNARGGIRDYTIDGVTGWVNRTNDAAGLARLMAAIIANPDSVAALSRSIRARRGEFIKTMRAHGEEIENLYRSLSGRSQRNRPLN
jgi:glycosyltransferase involved in cell wall biosynthesis